LAELAELFNDPDHTRIGKKIIKAEHRALRTLVELETAIAELAPMIGKPRSLYVRTVGGKRKIVSLRLEVRKTSSLGYKYDLVLIKPRRIRTIFDHLSCTNRHNDKTVFCLGFAFNPLNPTLVKALCVGRNGKIHELKVLHGITDPSAVRYKGLRRDQLLIKLWKTAFELIREAHGLL